MEGVVLFLWDRAPSLYPQISCLGLSESGNWSTSWMQSQLGPLVSPRLCPLRCGYVHTYAHQPPLLWFLPQQPQGRGRDSSAELAPPLQHVTLPDRKMLHALSSLGSWAPRQSRSDLFQNLAASLRLLSRWRLDVGEEEGATLGARGLAGGAALGSASGSVGSKRPCAQASSVAVSRLHLPQSLFLQHYLLPRKRARPAAPRLRPTEHRASENRVSQHCRCCGTPNTSQRLLDSHHVPHPLVY